VSRGPESALVAWHTLSIPDALTRLRSAPAGLDAAEAARRLREYGPNVLAVAKPASALSILLAQLRSVVVALLAVAALAAFLLSDALEAAAIGVVLLINVALGFVMELRARRSMEALLGLDAPRATVVRGGEVRPVAAREVVPGDVIVLEEGQAVPADARLLQSAELRTNEAALTGESLPASKRADAVLPPDTPLAERENLVYRSTLVVGGAGRAVVVATGAATEVGRIGTLVGAIAEEPAPLERRLDALGRQLVWIALGAGVLVGAMSYLQGVPWALTIETGLALAIAAVPEGLPVVATITLAIGVWRMARRNVLVRRLPAVESLGSATVVCTDKTGTLTAGEMTLTQLWAAGREWQVSGSGYATAGDFRVDGEPRAIDAAVQRALEIGALANRAAAGPSGAWHGDPTEVALLVAARKAGIDLAALRAAAPEVGEVPFSSERRFMATFHRASGGAVAYVKGAPGEVLARCTRIVTRAGEAPLEEEARRAVLEENERLAARGLRVLALAYGGAAGQGEEAVRELVLVALAGIEDPPAAGVRETILRFQSAGLRTLMITGDQRLTAAAIAEQLGIASAGSEVLEGRDLDRLSEAALDARLDRIAVVSRVSPEAKLRLVRALQGRGEIVAMLGDGVNDAPALKQADIGVAMGGRGTDVAKAAAGIVLRDDRFATIGVAVEEGRVVYDNIRKFVFYLFSCNLGEILVLLVAGLAGMALPLLPLQILWLNLVTDTFPALALAAEPAEPGVMQRPPRDPRAALLSKGFIGQIALYAALIAAATLAAYAWALGRAGEDAVSVSFTTLALAQIFHLGTARSRYSVLGGRVALANRWAVGAVGLTIALQLVALYWAPLASVLRLRPLTPLEWAVVAPLSLAPAVVGQLLHLRRAAQRPAAPG
jgi:Ca2+-transporting ATPase